MGLVLILIRHGEAVQSGADSKDHGRILTARGQRQSLALGEQLVQAGWQPTLALVSDAARTTQTWTGVAAGAGAAYAGTAVEHQRLIYSGAVKQLQQLLQAVDPLKHHTVVMVGHNPGISELAGDLAAQDLRLSPADGVVLGIQAESWVEAAASEGAWNLLARLDAL